MGTGFRGPLQDKLLGFGLGQGSLGFRGGTWGQPHVCKLQKRHHPPPAPRVRTEPLGQERAGSSRVQERGNFRGQDRAPFPRCDAEEASHFTTCITA